MEPLEFPIKAYSPKQLCAFYNCDRKTLRKWLRNLEKEIGPRIGNYFTPRQVRVLVELLGEP